MSELEKLHEAVIEGDWKAAAAAPEAAIAAGVAPLLIVTARLADERLWAEALNLGAQDVLATPFDATEVIRIVGIAQQRWRNARGLRASRGRTTMAVGASK